MRAAFPNQMRDPLRRMQERVSSKRRPARAAAPLLIQVAVFVASGALA